MKESVVLRTKDGREQSGVFTLAGGAAVLAVLYFVFERGLGIDLYPGVATQAAFVEVMQAAGASE